MIDRGMEVDPKRVEEGFGHRPLANNVDEEVNGNNKVARIEDDERERGERSAPAVERLLHEETKAAEPPPLMTTKQKSKRVATLDVFRGLTIVVIIQLHIYTRF